MKYWAIKTPLLSDGVYLSKVSSKMPESYKFDEGVSLVDEYPSVEDCKIYYDPNYPENICLYDFVSNISRLLIINSKVKSVFDNLGINNIEYLPIWLCNHKSEVSSKDYMICNVLGGVDIFDMEKSNYVIGSINKEQIRRVKSMTVNYDAIPEDAKVFRASKKLDQIFIRDDVKQALEEANIEGFSLKQADGWNGR